jgi:hypothetical protein
MSSKTLPDAALRDRIMADPTVVLDDTEIMRALVVAHDVTLGDNVVDLRTIAMERLEARLGQLADTHSAVLAAAYDNLSGTNQIHKAVLRILEPTTFEALLDDVATALPEILRVDAMRLVIETVSDGDEPAPLGPAGALLVAPAGFVESYFTGGRGQPMRKVTLREAGTATGSVMGASAPSIRSEACLRLDLGDARLPGMLVLGSADPHQFTPQQGTDLLGFFADAFERAIRRWFA